VAFNGKIPNQRKKEIEPYSSTQRKSFLGELKKVNINLSVETNQKIDRYCQDYRIGKSEYIRRLIEEDLKRKGY
jgi:hypothetical protein